VAKGLSYGPHSRHLVDIYRPAAAQHVPVVIFVHGGAFIRGDMNSNEQIYGNVLHYFARHGMVGVNVEYRLAPDAAYPEGAQDIADAIAWIRENIAAYGGDPNRLILMGHSAGGAHAATYMTDPKVRPVDGHGVAALVLISARLYADVLADNPNAAGVQAYWGKDVSLYEQVSPLAHAHRIDVPLMVVTAEYENPYLDIYGAEYYLRVLRTGRIRPRFLQIPRHNHTSIVAHLNTPDETLGLQLLDFIEPVCRAGNTHPA
jgi:acetyl esterase/lipase